MKSLKYYVSALLIAFGVLSSYLPAHAEGVNLIANPSAEQVGADNTQPANWAQSRWGNNTASLNYATDGYSGSRSLKTTMTAHTDGDAKWMHSPVSVNAGTEYTYSSWYKANVGTEIDMQYVSAGGAYSYAYIGYVAPSADWQRISFNLTVPSGVTKAVAMHVIADVGTLQIDDVYLGTTNAAPEEPPVPAPGMVLNGSLEDSANNLPTNWNKNAWGTNTASFTYENSGRTGNRSVKTTISAYTNGDAKWYADPIAVTAGSKYSYIDYYKSSVPTRVVAAYIDANGNYSYSELAGASASASQWAQYKTSFTVPANVSKVSIYHVIDRVGSLTIDDVSITQAETTPQSAVPNSSLEQSSNNQPTGWSSNNWGENNASFEYVNGGRTGSKSVKVTVSNYSSGDAKWYFNPISTLKEGTTYRFTAWYKTNVTPNAVVMFVMNDGSTRYAGMPISQPSGSTTEWQRYSDTFTVPAGAVGVSAFLFVTQNGWLQTDDYSVEEYSIVGFNRPLLTLTFDDGHEDNAFTALPIMNQVGIKSTQCYATSFIEGQSQDIIDGVMAFKNSGHEVCSHTVNHPFLTSLNQTDLNYELSHSQQYLRSITGATVDNFASPYGDYNANVVQSIKKYYRSHRSVDEGFNSRDNFDIYRLRVQNILSNTTAQQVASWIAEAQSTNTWLILVYHRVADDPGTYDSYVNDFQAQVNAIVSSGIVVKTYNEALNEVTSQL